MRTNIDIDEALMTAALSSGEFKTKREAVEEGLRLIARRNHYREILKWQGKLHWDDKPEPVQPHAATGVANENLGHSLQNRTYAGG